MPDLAAWTRFNAISMLNNERIPSSLELMMAALAANSVVGGSGIGVMDLLALNDAPLTILGVAGRVEI